MSMSFEKTPTWICQDSKGIYIEREKMYLWSEVEEDTVVSRPVIGR